MQVKSPIRHRTKIRIINKWLVEQFSSFTRRMWPPCWVLHVTLQRLDHKLIKNRTSGLDHLLMDLRDSLYPSDDKNDGNNINTITTTVQNTHVLFLLSHWYTTFLQVFLVWLIFYFSIYFYKSPLLVYIFKFIYQKWLNESKLIRLCCVFYHL